MDQDAAVKDLYERFPYPPPIEDMVPFTEGRRSATWNPRDSWSLYFPEEAQRSDPDILVAGCGTRAAVMMAACMPEARVLAIDISESSIAISSETAERGGLTNLDHRLMPLEEVSSLGRDFDLIHCHGVLHHLEDPVAGLKALGAVLRPRGAMSLMVYATYGRAGLYMLQDLGQNLDLPVTEQTARDLQLLCRNLPVNHPFTAMGQPREEGIPLAEVMDMLMHPRDVSYDAGGVRSLVEGAGLKFHRWIGLAPYSVSCSPHAGSAIGERIRDLPLWDQWSAMELLRGTISTHDFVVTHPERPSADDLFGGARILNAIPSQAAHAGVEQDGENAFLYSRAHSLERYPGLGVVESANAISALFRTFKGERSIGAIVEDETRGGSTPALREWLPRTCRRLYEADVVALRTTDDASSGS